MAYWRLLGALPQAKSHEEVCAQSLDGWNPWSDHAPLDEPDIVVPDPRGQPRFLHASLQSSSDPAAPTKFALTQLDDGMWCFYVPAEKDHPDAFEAMNPKYEGHWRQNLEDDSDLPWPAPAPGWPGRQDFLDALATKEAIAERVDYRGLSQCRLCGCQNGHAAFRLVEWEWPAGFRHYLEAHQVKPSVEFARFISDTP